MHRFETRTIPVIHVALVLISLVEATRAAAQTDGRQVATRPAQLRVFLDCRNCFQDFLRTEVTFVDYVRDRTEADVHVLITSTETAAGGREYTIGFTDLDATASAAHTLTTVTAQGDPEDIARRRIANALRVGLLRYVTKDNVPPDLTVTVRLGTESSARQSRAIAGGTGCSVFEGLRHTRARNPVAKRS